MMLFLVTALVLIVSLLFLLNQQVRLLIFVLKFVSTLLDAITLPIYLLIDRPWRRIKSRSASYAARRHYEPNGDYHYWEREKSTEILSEEQRKVRDRLQNVSHMSELLTIAQELHSGKRCLGTREVLSRRTENGQVKFELSSEYSWRSYEQTLETIRRLAIVLQHKFQLKRGDRVSIFAGTIPEYFIIFWALQSLGCEVLLLRSTPNESTVPTILNENKIDLVFIQSDFVKFMNKVKPEIRTVSKLVCFRSPYGGETDEKEIQNAKYDLYQYKQLLEESPALNDLNPLDNLNSKSFAATDTSLVLATSGSTGAPKYVLVSHANLGSMLKTRTPRSNEQTFLAYLDASTIFELWFEIESFAFGDKLAYGTMSTFLPDSPALASGSVGDLEAAEATIWIGGPFALEKAQTSIKALVAERSVYHSAIYKFAYNYKKMWTRLGLRCRLMDALLFNPIKRRFSKKLELIFTGGAPLLPETGVFLRMHLSTEMTFCYGTTETLAAAMATYDQFDHGNALGVHDGVKLRLVNWEEGGYRVDDKPNARGEILIGSGSVAAGYYENAEETNKAFFEENGSRWWRSGDIGEIDERGRLAIIDRKKNLAKLQRAGYFVALGKVESFLVHCPCVEQIAVYVNSYYNFVTALISPNEKRIRELARAMKKSIENLDELYEDGDVQRAVVEELARFGKASGLIDLELPAYVKLVREKWSPQNGLMTESLKISRQRIYAFYKQSIDELYRSLPFDLKS